MIAAACCGQDEALLHGIVDDFKVPQQFVQRIQEELERVRDQKSIRLFAQSLDMCRTKTDYYQKEEISLKEILNEWEQQYLTMDIKQE